MTEPLEEPPLADELPEMIQRAADCDDPHVFRILDAVIEARKRRIKRKPPEPAA